MSRLASLNRSSTPSPSPSSRPTAKPPTPSQPFPQDTSTYHRKLRALFLELRSSMMQWDEVVADGLKWGKGMVDEGTEMDNVLQLEEDHSRPPITPHWEAYLVNRSSLESNFMKLNRLLQKLRLLVDTAEGLLLEALKLKPIEFSLVEPLWAETGTWTFEHFGEQQGVGAVMPESSLRYPELTTTVCDTLTVESVQPVPTQHSTHLSHLTHLLDPVLTHSPSPHPNLTLFETQKLALESYRDAATRSERHEWRDAWVEMVGSEMGGWEGWKGEEVEEDLAPFSGKKGGKGRKGRGGSVEL